MLIHNLSEIFSGSFHAPKNNCILRDKFIFGAVSNLFLHNICLKTLSNSKGSVTGVYIIVLIRCIKNVTM